MFENKRMGELSLEKNVFSANEEITENNYVLELV